MKTGLGHFPMCQALHLLGEHERELEVARDGLNRFPRLEGQIHNGLVINVVVALAARVGDRQAAEEALRRLDELASADRFGADSYWRACITAELGDREQAVEQLHATLRAGFQFNLTFHRNPWLDSLHGYEPFEEFLRPKG